MKDQINEVFDSIQMPDSCAQQIRSALDQGAVTPKKPRRLLLRSLIAAAIAACLLLSVAAAGLSKGWLDDFLGESETVEHVQELDITANFREQEVTLERLLMDGPFLYLQVSLRTQGDVNAAEVFESFYEYPETSPKDRVSLHIANGMLVLPLSEHGKEQTGLEFLSVGAPARSFRLSRLDDGSDINFCSYTMQFLILDLPADYEGLKLRLRLEGQRTWYPDGGDRWDTQERQVFLLEEEITLTDVAAREAQMEDGCAVKLHSLGVQIHGRDFADVAKGAQEWGVVLRDGTKIPFNNSYLTRDYYEEAAQWSLFSLSRMVDPAEVSAIYLDQTLYPLT